MTAIQDNLLEGEGAIIQVTRTTLTPHAQLLADVVALAAHDCQRALKAHGDGGLSRIALAEAASACRFFESPEGQAMILACGLGHDGVRMGLALADTCRRRLPIPPIGFRTDDNYAWRRALNNGDLVQARARRTHPRLHCAAA